MDENEAWGNPMSTVPRDGTPVLVKLETHHLGSLYQVGVFHKNVAFIGSHFDFDVPKAIGWKAIEGAEPKNRRQTSEEKNDGTA